MVTRKYSVKVSFSSSVRVHKRTLDLRPSPAFSLVNIFLSPPKEPGCRIKEIILHRRLTPKVNVFLLGVK